MGLYNSKTKNAKKVSGTPTFPNPSLANPTHRLEDVIDQVQYRLVGNGIIIKVVRTVAWGIDLLNWRSLSEENIDYRLHASSKKKDYRLHVGPLPIHEYGIICNPKKPLIFLCEIFDQNGELVAKGDMITFFVEQKNF